VPVATGATAGVSVDEDELAIADGDLSDGITDGDGESDEATFSAAALQALVTTGADEPVTFSLDLTVDGAAVVTTAGANVFSGGDQVLFNDNGGVIEGVADGRVVFTLSDNGDGSFTFDLKDQLDHSGGGDDETLLLDLTGAFGAVDADGDAVSPRPCCST
jgi:T1SS-143 domain-containing protein